MNDITLLELPLRLDVTQRATLLVSAPILLIILHRQILITLSRLPHVQLQQQLHYNTAHKLLIYAIDKKFGHVRLFAELHCD